MAVSFGSGGDPHVQSLAERGELLVIRKKLGELPDRLPALENQLRCKQMHLQTNRTKVKYTTMKDSIIA